MNPVVALLQQVVQALDDAGIPHMLVGSLASMTHGAPRATQDIDIVIDPTPDALDTFVESFDPDRFYIGPDPQEALADRDQFNLIDPTTGWKVDLMIHKGDQPFNKSEFGRRVRARVFDVDLFVASKEDTILAKLVWAAMGGSGRQIEDAAGVLAVKAGDLDEEYLDHWAAELGVTELLERARRG